MAPRVALALSPQLAVLVACGGCSNTRLPARADHAPAPALQPAPSLAPPTKAFVAPQAWRSKGKPAISVEPPDLTAQTWRVFVEQYAPHQRKTPVWQPLPACEAVELAMPPGSRFRCIANPLSIEPAANAFGTRLSAWLLARSVFCSSDGWRTWTEYPHRVRLLADGKSKLDYQSDALLRERGGDGAARQTLMVVRSEPERREATLGPPRVLPGAKLDPE